MAKAPTPGRGRRRASRPDPDELRALYDSIRKDPDDPAPYLVLADLLQAHGDPRGELVTVQHARATADTPELAKAEQLLLARRRTRLLGSSLTAAIRGFGDLEIGDEIALAWRLGHLSAVRVKINARADEVLAFVDALFAAPAGAVLDSLDLQVNLSDQDRMEAVIDAIATRAPTTLRELRIASANCHVRNLHRAWPRLSRLRALRIGQWGGIDIGELGLLANLEDLELVGPERPTIETIRAQAPPRLRRLHLDVFSEVPLELVTPLLEGALPSLRDVGLFANGVVIDVAHMALGSIRALALGPVTAHTIETVLASGRELERLQLAFTKQVSRADLQPILDGALPALRELYLGGLDGVSLLAPILSSTILPQLAVLDLVDVDTDELPDLAEHAERLAHLDVLRFVTPPSLDRKHPALARIEAAVKEVVFVENRVLRAVRDYRDPLTARAS